MNVWRLATRIATLSIAILWASWALNNDLVERGWLAKGRPLVVTGVGLMVGWGAWMFWTRPWEREERMPYALPLAEEIAERERVPDPLVPVTPEQEMAARLRDERTRIAAGDVLLLVASLMLLVAAVSAMPRVAEGLRTELRRSFGPPRPSTSLHHAPPLPAQALQEPALHRTAPIVAVLGRR